jgi:hypothetical protein
MGVSGQRHAQAAFCPRERTPVPTGYEAGWASELVWTQRLEEKSFASAGDRTQVLQAVVIHYTEVPPAHLVRLYWYTPQKPSVTIAGLRDENWIQYLPNKKQEC